MAEDAKAAKNRRLAEALRANLKRRKSAERAATPEANSDSGTSQKSAGADTATADGGMD